MNIDEKHIKGRGAQLNPKNQFLKNQYVEEFIEGLDEPLIDNPKTEFFLEHPKNILNKVSSPDLGLMNSINPYQGCEHGCAYCYARNVHTYWGFSAGLDFEQKIIVKPDAAKLLEEIFLKPNYKVEPITLSGNTDCYQPAEKKFKITRQLLEVFVKYKHPVAIISKNSLILRDIDLLQELAKHQLVRAIISITTLKEELRQKMEPRTATIKNRLRVIEELNKNGIPCGVMNAPIIPGLNSSETPAVIKAAADHGALYAGYTIVRLNGALAEIFTDWVKKTFPDAAEKILNHIKSAHGGQLNDSRFGTRMRGEGEIAASIRQLFYSSVKKYLSGRTVYELNLKAFQRPADKNGQMNLF
jgi:DNA repair photolyase